jgi:hypothetical protein
MVTLNTQNCARELIRTFIILDLETTGLPYDKPVRITEIAMVAALREHILGYRTDVTCKVLPRVLSKLTVCVHPRRTVSKRAAEITRMLYSFCHLPQLCGIVRFVGFKVLAAVVYEDFRLLGYNAV